MNKITLTLVLCICLITPAIAQENYPKIHVTDDIEIIKLSDHSYIHVSYAQMPPWGRVPSNGLIFANKGKAFLFDTPVNDSLTKDLVNWIENSLKVEIIGFIPNHWHSDCMGGIRYLQRRGIDSYAYELTRKIAKTKKLPVPTHGFSDSLDLQLGGERILCKYYGAAHTLDNIVVWIPSEKILFAGCMAKELKATGLGNTVDGNIQKWPKTIEKVLQEYHDAKIVIPGHGEYGGIDLLQHTLKLLKEKEVVH